MGQHSLNRRRVQAHSPVLHVVLLCVLTGVSFKISFLSFCSADLLDDVRTYIVRSKRGTFQFCHIWRNAKRLHPQTENKTEEIQPDKFGKLHGQYWSTSWHKWKQKIFTRAGICLGKIWHWLWQGVQCDWSSTQSFGYATHLTFHKIKVHESKQLECNMVEWACKSLWFYTKPCKVEWNKSAVQVMIGRQE